MNDEAQYDEAQYDEAQYDPAEFGDGADDRVAVVGLAGRFPGANNIDEFWDNLVNEVDSLHTFSDEELEDLGITSEVYGRDNFVRRGTILENHDHFDAKRFGFSPREAATTDPQARVFLETVHDALEHAGYDPFSVPGEVGIFAGCNPVDYALLLGRPDPTDSLSAFDQMIGTDREFLATRVAHRLGLTGPALNVQSACSTSLVAIHLAAQHLLEYQCSVAVAGGVSINLRQGVGYFYQQGMILSPDGVCRAFDQGANGTTLGQASGAVILKRLSDAVADGDTIHAVVSASALNNDGDRKISYTAPSAEGQAEVIATTHALADLRGEDITYVETHGTGTKLGDPVEIAGLTRAFRLTTEQEGFCAVGAVKTSVGHTDAAAGVTGFIKAVLAVREGIIPATLHYETANEAIDFEHSPFYVASSTQRWEPTTTDLRRAGISSFGIGGTNAHIVIEEPPTSVTHDEAAPSDHKQPRLIVSSAPTPAGAKLTSDSVQRWVTSNNGISPAAAAMLVSNRKHWDERCARTFDPVTRTLGKTQSGRVKPDATSTWLFSGQGAQFAGMASGMYDHLETFRQTLDRIMFVVRDRTGLDLASPLLADRDDADATSILTRTEYTQPALFACQMAMARQLQAWGLQPRALAGHSIGEFAAAVIAGVMTEADGASAVCERGRLMQSMEPGAMVATRIPAVDLAKLLPVGVDLATDNSSSSSVAAGPHDAIDQLEQILADAAVDYQRLATSHAFHSASMEPAREQFATFLKTVVLSEPTVPLLSNVTGTWITPTQATDADFWASQIRNPVLFRDCLRELATTNDVLVEVGPGRALSAFAAGHDSFSEPPDTVQCLGHAKDKRPGQMIALDAVGQLWTYGIEPDWNSIQPSVMTSKRVPAPLSVFDRKRHWLPKAQHVLALAPDQTNPDHDSAALPLNMSEPGEDGLSRLPRDQWCYGRSWQRTVTPKQCSDARILVLSDGSPTCAAIVAGIRQQASELVEVKLGAQTDLTGFTWTLALDDEAGIEAILKRLTGVSRKPDRVIHLWLAKTPDPTSRVDLPQPIVEVDHELSLGVHTLHALARRLAPLSQDRSVHIDIVTAGAHQVVSDEPVRPARTAVAGPVKVIPLEYAGITARHIDISLAPSPIEIERCVTELLSANPTNPVVAVRANYAWAHTVALLPGDDPAASEPSLIRTEGVYVLFGGLGGVGLSIAEHLADTYHANIVLVGRSGAPKPDPSNPETTRRLERLESVRASAASVTIATGDITNADQVRRIIEDVESTVGAIDGVLLTAAVPDTQGAIHRRTREAATESISAKVHGSLVLAEALGERELDFVVLSSSIASQLYHNRFGQVGYVTANSFAEGVAESAFFRAKRVVTIAWDDWIEIGMSVRAAQDFAQTYGDEISLMDEVHSFAPADGVQVLEQALRAEDPTIFVSTTDLQERIKNDAQQASPFLSQALQADAEPDGPNAMHAASVAETVRGVWESLLGLTEIDEEDDFFDLGGDSLQVARMADRFARKLDLDVSLDVIFDNPTLRELVLTLESLNASSSADAAVELQGEIPLSPPQRRFFDRGSKRSAHFNVSVLLKPVSVGDHTASEHTASEHTASNHTTSSATTLEPKDLESALRDLVTRHSALRTTFKTSEAGTTQWVESAETANPVALEHVEVSNQPVERAAEIDRLCQRAHEGFDLAVAPLAKAILFQDGEGFQRVFLAAHHLVSDRVSLLSMIDDLDARLAGSDLRDPTYPYSNWSQDMASFGSDAEASQRLTEWQEKLPAEDLSLPGQVKGQNTNEAADALFIDLDESSSQALLRGGQGRVDEKLLLVLADALAGWVDHSAEETSPTRHIGIDVLGHGRRDLRDRDVSRTAGFFLSYSPVWVGVGNAHEDRLSDIREQLDTGWTFDALRYANSDETLRWIRPRILFNFVGRPVTSDEPQVLEVVAEAKGSDTHPENVRDHDLAFMAEITETDRVRLTMVFSRNRLSSSLVKDLESRIHAALLQIGEEPASTQC